MNKLTPQELDQLMKPLKELGRGINVLAQYHEVTGVPTAIANLS